MVLTKEYRIVLPFTLEQYRVGQLYLTAKSSQSHSSDGQGVEVLVNQPFENKELGKGQYTKKIFHFGDQLPAFIRYLFSSLNHLSVVEESWNSYPDCKTIFHCEYLGDAFSIEVLTKHTEGELGKEKNIHNLNQQQLIEREVDYIDIVNDPITASAYKKEEDPTLFQSKRADIEPLTADWMKQKGRSIMCAYKLVRVKYNKWIVGPNIEKAIHDWGFRAIFIEANRQAFCWQDEWLGMTLDDIRQFEAECATKQNLAIADGVAANKQHNKENKSGSVNDDTDHDGVEEKEACI